MQSGVSLAVFGFAGCARLLRENRFGSKRALELELPFEERSLQAGPELAAEDPAGHRPKPQRNYAEPIPSAGHRSLVLPNLSRDKYVETLRSHVPWCAGMCGSWTGVVTPHQIFGHDLT